MARAKLRNGVIGAAGGKRKNSGRKPDWFIKKCQEIATSDKALKFLQSVINGDPVEEKKLLAAGQEPIVVWESASVDARVRAWNSVMDRGFGKALQAVEHSGTVATKYIINITDPE